MANPTLIPLSIELPAPFSDWEADILTRTLVQRTGGRLAIPSHEGLAIIGRAGTVGAAQRLRERDALPFREIELGKDGRKFVTVPELVRVLLGREPRGVSESAPAPTKRRGRPPMAAPARQCGAVDHG